MAGDGPRISTDEVQRVTGAHQFWAIRGHAIQSYANLEQALCDLFSSLAGMDRETGSIIFFRVTNAQARNSILEKLITKRFADEYNSFRNSLLRQLRPIDIERNEIVHWNALDVVVINETGKTNAYPALVPPSPWPFRANAPRKSAPDLVVFMKKCEFYIRLVRAFNFYIMEEFKNYQDQGLIGSQDELNTWQNIFRLPVIYPPPADHPLSQTPPTPDTPPQPSRA